MAELQLEPASKEMDLDKKGEEDKDKEEEEAVHKEAAEPDKMEVDKEPETDLGVALAATLRGDKGDFRRIEYGSIHHMFAEIFSESSPRGHLCSYTEMRYLVRNIFLQYKYPL